jgi:hypothetical protein
VKATSLEVLKMLAEKKPLGVEDLEAQAAFELPDRELMALVNIFIPITITDLNVIAQVPIGVAANVCDVNVAVLANQEFEEGETACDAESTQIPIAFLQD